MALQTTAEIMSAVPPVAEYTPYMIHNDWVEPVFVKGSGAIVEDEQGKDYVDLEGGPGVTSVGHCHPDVVRAVQEQAGKLLIVPGRYMGRPALTLAKRIAEYVGNQLEMTFFCNSGAEAAEGAVKLALKHSWTKQREGQSIIALQHGYHGRLGLSLALTALPKMKKGMGSFGTHPGVVHAPAPYCYRCPLGLQYPSCNIKCADAVDELMDTSVQGQAAAFIAEPILGVGGVIVPPDEYWPKMQAILKKHGVPFILDEVFTGFGRTGEKFAHQAYGVQPDVMAFAKAIGGGVPLGGFIATRELGNVFKTADHSTTYGGKNQLGIAAGHAVLDILKKESLEDAAKERGAQFMAGLRELQRRYPVIGEVRGKGLFIAMEIVADAKRTPDTKLAKALANEALNQGLILSATGTHGNNLRITPPLVITLGQVERALVALGETFARTVPASGRV
jgi:4-aminobutyrate aminotransferase / (S)-3-amino-2-methylpropionate transaminase / 5-aminovalerate transaminase